MWLIKFAANNLGVDALFVYTKDGHMASLLSRCRPDCPIFAFTTTTSVRRRLNLQWGLIPFRLSFSDDMESNLNKTFSLLKARGMIKSGDLVVAVSDMLQSIQVMNVPWEHNKFWHKLLVLQPPSVCCSSDSEYSIAAETNMLFQMYQISNVVIYRLDWISYFSLEILVRIFKLLTFLVYLQRFINLD